MNRREKTLVWVVSAAAGLFVLDSFVLTPYFKQRDTLAELRSKNDSEAEDAYQVRNQESDLKDKWGTRRSQGLTKDPKDAEKQVLSAIHDWARESGLTIASVKPERIESKKELREIQFLASAAGTNEALVKFLFKLQTAKFPIRMTEFQAGSRNDTLELAMQMRISTLYMLDDKKDVKEPKDPKDGKNSALPGNSKKAESKNVAVKKTGNGNEF